MTNKIDSHGENTNRSGQSIMTEQWVKWEPIAGLAEHYNIDEVLNTVDGLSIVLSKTDGNNDVKIRVTFDTIEAYRSTYETFRIKISDQYMGWTFFRIENSEYLQWLSEQSHGMYDDFKFLHFAIATDDTVLDIIAKHEPKVEFVYE
jgi:hypothetical protein